ncbi:DUF1190 domain-containing protein [Marinomonas sp. C2222]|uniref:DUF1190 domain-containing protein n=1 Tax=Marinomonas sargassi TaxID=2984494 RepID=A0ABT2YTF7_9GAMM|nr:DUF1190 domain-containing protein [Marinomonas sargassi]MCV2403177.1 DUF1190 domain-containing protein [Marinomonas sargassi]
MKRSKQINIAIMRKELIVRPLLKPVALAVASITLVACGNEEDVKVASSVDDCVSKTDLTQEQCEVAYQKALEEAARTAPRYNSLSACGIEFGQRYCHQSPDGFFVPYMSGFMVSNAFHHGYVYNPVFYYRNSRSSYHGRVMLSDGTVIGSAGRSSYKVPKSTLSSKPTPTRTVSRGGFGSVASAKSNWGGGKSKSWGG